VKVHDEEEKENLTFGNDKLIPLFKI